MIKLRQLLESRKLNWIIALIVGSVTILANITLFATSGWFITASAIAGIISGGLAYTFNFLTPAVIVRFCAILRTAGRYGERLLSHNAALGLLKDLRCQIFNLLSTQKNLNFSAKEISNSRILHRLISDIDLLDHFPLKFFSPWVWASFISCLILIFFTLISFKIFLIMSIFLLLAWIIIPLLTLIKGIKLAQIEHELAEQRRFNLLEPLQILLPLILWKKWNYFENQFFKTDESYQLEQNKQKDLVNLTSLIQQWIIGLGLLCLIWQIMFFVENNQVSLPIVVAGCLILLSLPEFLIPLSNSFISLGFSSSAKNRLNSLIKNEDNLILENNKNLEFNSFKVEDLTAKYPLALFPTNKINFEIKKGQSLLITGNSGSGKSTLLQTLSGWLKINSGDILIDNKKVNSDELNNLVAILSQNIEIFDMTIANNLKLAKENANNEELWQVLELVDLANWLKEQPDELNTLVGEYGSKLSGGQARRLALARLLLLNREILLLDEPFAGLDLATSKKILNGLLEYQKDKILIIVSHQKLSQELDLNLVINSEIN